MIEILCKGIYPRHCDVPVGQYFIKMCHQFWFADGRKLLQRKIISDIGIQLPIKRTLFFCDSYKGCQTLFLYCRNLFP